MRDHPIRDESSSFTFSQPSSNNAIIINIIKGIIYIKTLPLLGHVSEGLREVLLAEGELADSPDFGVLDPISNVCEIHAKERTYGLEVLLQLSVEGAGLEGNDLGGGIGVVGDGGTALGAEESVDDVAGRALGAGVGLDGAVEGELVLLDDSDESYRGVSRLILLCALHSLQAWFSSFRARWGKRTVGGTALALAVVAVVVANKERGLHVNRVGDGLAETVSGERHID